MVKTFKNLLWNQKADDLETWYATSGAGVLPSIDLSETLVVYDVKVGKVGRYS